MLKLVHTGDLQLGYAQYGFKQRKTDFNRAARSAIELAPVIHADCVVLAGDLFEVPEPPASAVLALQRAVLECTAAGIPVLGVYGNHDAGDMDPEEHGGWLSVCGITNLEDSCAEINGLRIGGLSFRLNELFERDLELYLQKTEPLDVLVLHQALAEFTGFPVPLTAARVAELIKASPSAKSCKAVLLGDIHIHEVKDVSGITFTYCGATEWNSAGESPVKRVSEVTVTKDHVSIEGHLLETRQILRHKIETPEDVDKLRGLLAEDPEGAALYDVVFNPEIPDIRRELRTVLKSRMYRMAFLPKKGSGLTSELMVPKGSTEQVRGATTAALRTALDEKYEVGDVRRELITRLLDNPKDIEQTVTQFIKEHTDERKDED